MGNGREDGVEKGREEGKFGKEFGVFSWWRGGVWETRVVCGDQGVLGINVRE